MGTVLAFAAVGTLTSPPIGGGHCRGQWGQLHLYVCLFRRELYPGHHRACGSARAAFWMGPYDEDLNDGRNYWTGLEEAGVGSARRMKGNDSDLFSILFPSIYVEKLSLKRHVSTS
jgi:hypothetical protein